MCFYTLVYCLFDYIIYLKTKLLRNLNLKIMKKCHGILLFKILRDSLLLRVYYIEFKPLHLESVHFSCAPVYLSVLLSPCISYSSSKKKIKLVLLVKAAFFSWSLHTHFYTCLKLPLHLSAPGPSHFSAKSLLICNAVHKLPWCLP